MGRVVIQAGHCHRRTGTVGTRSADGYTEQQFTWSVANRAVAMLRNDGHAALVIEADVPSYSYRGDAFVAVHADGSGNPNVHGASVGYRSNEGRALAHAWKAAYKALGWPGGFRGDNYTAALGGYYGTRRAVEQGNRRACILEFGFLTNPTEAAILRSTSGQERSAQAVRRAVNASLGTTPAPQPSEEDVMDPVSLVFNHYATYFKRLPENLWVVGKHAEYIEAHGSEKFTSMILNSSEGKQKWPR